MTRISQWCVLTFVQPSVASTGPSIHQYRLTGIGSHLTRIDRSGSLSAASIFRQLWVDITFACRTGRLIAASLAVQVFSS